MYKNREERLENSRKYYQTHKEQVKKHNKEYNRINQEKVRERKEIYYNTHKQKYKIYHQEHRQEILSRHRNQQLQRMYGITSEQYDEMFIEQGGLCSICGYGKSKIRLSVDHNHKTKVVRGLLCSFCNKSLGWYEKYQNKIDEYLQKIKEKPSEIIS